jgi:hypothetical protein
MDAVKVGVAFGSEYESRNNPENHTAPKDLQMALISLPCLFTWTWGSKVLFSGSRNRELFSIYGMRNELLRHCRIPKVALIDGTINDWTFESMAMDRVLESGNRSLDSRFDARRNPGECIDPGSG